MRIDDRLKNCAVFLGINRIAGVEATAVFAGTGFFVTVDYEGETFPYIVTARHIIEDMNAFARRHPKSEKFVRLNDHTGQAFQVIITGSTWVRSDDNMVDIAICPIEFPGQGLTFIPESTFLQPSRFRHYGVGIGDDVFSVGLLSFVVSERTNVPVVRYGTLAMLPEEPVKTKSGLREVYLIEARSIGGLSGSPVFVRETLWLGPEQFKDGDEVVTIRPYAVGRTFLLGLMRGHWDIDPETIGAIDIRTKKAKEGGVNLGIAMVTPVEKISALLHGRTLTAEREERIKEIRKAKSAKQPEETTDTHPDDGDPFEPTVSPIFQVTKSAIAKPGAKKKPKRKK